jgi:hypothetical protein
VGGDAGGPCAAVACLAVPALTCPCACAHSRSRSNSCAVLPWPCPALPLREVTAREISCLLARRPPNVGTSTALIWVIGPLRYTAPGLSTLPSLPQIGLLTPPTRTEGLSRAPMQLKLPCRLASRGRNTPQIKPATSRAIGLQQYHRVTINSSAEAGKGVSESYGEEITSDETIPPVRSEKARRRERAPPTPLSRQQNHSRTTEGPRGKMHTLDPRRRLH